MMHQIILECPKAQMMLQVTQLRTLFKILHLQLVIQVIPTVHIVILHGYLSNSLLTVLRIEQTADNLEKVVKHPTMTIAPLLIGGMTAWMDSFIEMGGGPRVVVSTAAFHARVRGSVPGLGGSKETKIVSSPSTCES